MARTHIASSTLAQTVLAGFIAGSVIVLQSCAPATGRAGSEEKTATAERPRAVFGDNDESSAHQGVEPSPPVESPEDTHNRPARRAPSGSTASKSRVESDALVSRE